MIKKTALSEYALLKKYFQGMKLKEGDEILKIVLEPKDYTIVFVTNQGMVLNALTNDIPLQGRISGGVRGIQLREEDYVILMTQQNGDGEIVIATDEGRFKRVIVSQIEPTGRYKKGSSIVGLREGASVLCASYVTVPYYLAVVVKGNMVSELSTEDTFILMQSAKAKRVMRYEEDSVVKVFPMPYKKAD